MVTDVVGFELRDEVDGDVLTAVQLKELPCGLDSQPLGSSQVNLGIDVFGFDDEVQRHFAVSGFDHIHEARAGRATKINRHLDRAAWDLAVDDDLVENRVTDRGLFLRGFMVSLFSVILTRYTAARHVFRVCLPRRTSHQTR